jgi:hypothetical protein
MDTSDPVALGLRSNAVALRAIAEITPATTAAHLCTIAEELERLAAVSEDAERQDHCQWIV